MNCEECKINQKRFTEESTLAMAERTVRRLWITTLVLIVALVGVCVGFFLHESQFEEYKETFETGTEVDALQFGRGNFVSGGDLSYGAGSPSEEEYEGNQDIAR